MWSQEVIVSHPESQVIVGTVDVIKSVRAAVRSLVRAGSSRSIICLKGRCSLETASSLVSQRTWVTVKGKVFTKLFNSIAAEDMHYNRPQQVKVFREFCKPMENIRIARMQGITPVIGYLIAENGTCGGVHNQPDVSFDAAGS